MKKIINQIRKICFKKFLGVKNDDSIVRTRYNTDNKPPRDLKDYPDKCRFCGGPAYVCLNNDIDCLHRCKESQEHNK